MVERLTPHRHDIDGYGVTSQRSRDRLADMLNKEGISDPQVLEAIRYTPRHMFIDPALNDCAYENTSLPIGFGQTISQPYIVAIMTELAIKEGCLASVLEVGTGCGYQTTILSKVFKHVYSVERIESLVHRARERLHCLGVRNVKMRHADGYLGWEQYAPFDAIMVTAAPGNIPKPLLDQLAIGGRLVIPVGSNKTNQQLIVVDRALNGFTQRLVENVCFVPLVSGLK